ncbi:MAG: heavy-metal-associated domain-containing protein, partial [Methylocystaceae bacterium]|nr:heavy-metal-associated domain-containing protein [Methylocystaceae bacterium]
MPANAPMPYSAPQVPVADRYTPGMSGPLGQSSTSPLQAPFSQAWRQVNADPSDGFFKDVSCSWQLVRPGDPLQLAIQFPMHGKLLPYTVTLPGCEKATDVLARKLACVIYLGIFFVGQPVKKPGEPFDSMRVDLPPSDLTQTRVWVNDKEIARCEMGFANPNKEHRAHAPEGVSTILKTFVQEIGYQIWIARRDAVANEEERRRRMVETLDLSDPIALCPHNARKEDRFVNEEWDLKLRVKGMTCGNCENSIQSQVAKLPQVQEVIASVVQQNADKESVA